VIPSDGCIKSESKCVAGMPFVFAAGGLIAVLSKDQALFVPSNKRGRDVFCAYFWGL
jgi:hypothetical protein